VLSSVPFYFFFSCKGNKKIFLNSFFLIYRTIGTFLLTIGM